MSIDNVTSFNPRALSMETGKIADANADTTNRPAPAPSKVIDFDRMKAILYLGIRGEILLPIQEQHTIDTFA